MAFVYMPERQQALLFGGTDSMNQGLSDTWVWQAGSGCWSQLSPSISPSARDGMAAAYDPNHHVVVLYGGHGAGQFLSDTWTWNGQSWSQVASAGPPDLIGDQIAGFDPKSQRIVLFGETSAIAQTWSWDGANWHQLSPSRSPDARDAPSLALDPVRGQLLLFGGRRFSTKAGNDTWTWDGTNWTQLTPVTSPPPRFRATMVSWAAGHGVILRGGVGIGVDDAWAWDGANWTLIASPGVRADAGAIDVGPRVLFFGGDRPAGHYNDFEAWDGATWSASTT
jgi:hypothetical protein